MQRIDVIVAIQDSGMLELLCGSVSADPALRLAGRCRTGQEAQRLMKAAARPGAVALDTGLADSAATATDLIGASRVPVVAMCKTALNAMRLLKAGAADFLLMPAGGSESDCRLFTGEAIDRLKIAAYGATSQNRQGIVQHTHKAVRLIAAVGAQGGPVQLACLLRGLPSRHPPVIAMQAGANDEFIELLGSRTGKPVVAGEAGMELIDGMVCIVGSGFCAGVQETSGTLRLILDDASGKPADSIADRFLQSVAQVMGESAAGISFSGEGAQGLAMLAEGGALAVMLNKNALLREIGYRPPGQWVELPLEDIAAEIRNHLE